MRAATPPALGLTVRLKRDHLEMPLSGRAHAGTGPPSEATLASAAMGSVQEWVSVDVGYRERGPLGGRLLRQPADLDLYCPYSGVTGEGVGVHSEVQSSGGRGDQDGSPDLEGLAVSDPGDQRPARQLRCGELRAARGVVGRRLA
jgi:hypothetical protein